MAKNTADTRTSTPVQIRICIKKIKTGNAALASTIKNRVVRAESRQLAVAENPPAAILTPNFDCLIIIFGHGPMLVPEWVSSYVNLRVYRATWLKQEKQ